MASTLLGTDMMTQRAIALSVEERTRHVLILGKTGTGKSNLMLEMIRQDIEQGHGLCVIDPFGQLTERVLTHIPPERERDVVLLDLSDTGYPFGINIFQPGTRPAEVTALFQKVWGNNWGTLIQKWLSAITYTFSDAGEGTLADVPRLFGEMAYRQRLLGKLQNFQAKSDWQRAIRKDGSLSELETGSTANRISLFLYDDVLLNIVGQQETTVDFAELVKEGKIVLCKLAAQTQETQGLIGTLLIQRLTKAIIGTYRERHFFVYCDEFQRFATPDMIALITGGRQFHVGMTLATQSLSQIKDGFIQENLPNVGSTIAFQLPDADAASVARTLRKLPRKWALHPEPYTMTLRDEFPDQRVNDLMQKLERLMPLSYINRQRMDTLILMVEKGETRDMEPLLWEVLGAAHKYQIDTINTRANAALGDQRFLYRYRLPSNAGLQWAKTYLIDVRRAWETKDYALLNRLQNSQVWTQKIYRYFGVPEQRGITHESLGQWRGDYLGEQVKLEWMDAYHAAADAVLMTGFGQALLAALYEFAGHPVYDLEGTENPTTQQLSRSLASLESDFGRGTAVAKLLTGEHTLKTPLVADGPHRPMKRIRERSRERYARERWEVGWEIKERFAASAEPSEPADRAPRRPPEPPQSPPMVRRERRDTE